MSSVEGDPPLCGSLCIRIRRPPYLVGNVCGSPRSFRSLRPDSSSLGSGGAVEPWSRGAVEPLICLRASHMQPVYSVARLNACIFSQGRSSSGNRDLLLSCWDDRVQQSHAVLPISILEKDAAIATLRPIGLISSSEKDLG